MHTALLVALVSIPAADQRSLAQIRAAVAEQDAQIKSVQVRYESIPFFTKFFRESARNPRGMRYYAKITGVWAMDWETDVEFHETTAVREDERITRSRDVFDGEFFREYGAKDGARLQLERSTRIRDPRRDTSSYPAAFTGLVLPHVGASLAELFRSHRLERLGVESVHDVPCERLRIHLEGALEVGHCDVWLDPAQGFLPRRLQKSLQPNDEASKSWLLLENQEFGRFEAADAGVKIPFPVRSRREVQKEGQLAFGNDFRVLDVRINAPFDLKQLAAEQAAGGG